MNIFFLCVCWHVCFFFGDVSVQAFYQLGYQGLSAFYLFIVRTLYILKKAIFRLFYLLWTFPSVFFIKFGCFDILIVWILLFLPLAPALPDHELRKGWSGNPLPTLPFPWAISFRAWIVWLQAASSAWNARWVSPTLWQLYLEDSLVPGTQHTPTWYHQFVPTLPSIRVLTPPPT